MDESITKLEVYSVIMLRYNEIILNIVEITVLGYLKEGRTKTDISELLGFNIEQVIEGLKEKKILNQTAGFRYKNNQDWLEFAEKAYKRGYIFKDSNKNVFFDRFIYPHEVKFDEDFILVENLGNDYLAEDIIDTMHVINSFDIYYNSKKHTKVLISRRISGTLPDTCIYREC